MLRLRNGGTALDESMYDDLFETPLEDEIVSEFERAVQEFELSRGAEDDAGWAEKYETAEPQVDEAPIIEITTPIPPPDEPEAEPELSDFEKAMRVFDTTIGTTERGICTDRSGCHGRLMDEEIEPW